MAVLLPQNRFSILSFLLAFLLMSGCGGNTDVQQHTVISQPSSTITSSPTPQQQADRFTLWVADFKREALAKGITEPVINDAFSHITEPSQKVISHDHTQPEQTKTFDSYVQNILKPRRLEVAQEQWESHKELLKHVHRTYGVSPFIMLALWQTESNFGKNQGSYLIVSALATLAYDGRRAEFFRRELLDSLLILQQEHMSADMLTGSWAGAMGQVQFMPSSYLAFAVDFDGDGKRDIWNSDADAVASMANYLHTRGWDESVGWGVHVRVPGRSDVSTWVTSKTWHTMKQWQKLGVHPLEHRHGYTAETQMRLVMPDNDPDYAFLVTSNYDVIIDWNHSTYFATSIGMLADAIDDQERQ